MRVASIKKSLFSALFALGAYVAGVTGAAAAPVDVSYSATGGPGAWTYDFSVTNNLPDTNTVYAFSVLLPGDLQTATPPGWTAFDGTISPSVEEWCFATSCYIYAGGIAPGQTLSGFELLDTSSTELNSIDWAATADGGSLGNPTFTGTASVPEPGSFVLLLSGLTVISMLVLALRRKNQRPNAEAFVS